MGSKEIVEYSTKGGEGSAMAAFPLGNPPKKTWDKNTGHCIIINSKHTYKKIEAHNVKNVRNEILQNLREGFKQKLVEFSTKGGGHI